MGERGGFRQRKLGGGEKKKNKQRGRKENGLLQEPWEQNPQRCEARAIVWEHRG